MRGDPGRGGLPFLRIFDFEIRIDRSWFILLALIIWSFSGAVFPAQYPGRSTAVYLVMGVAAAVLLFASLIAHELSHAVVARAKGIPVEGITLFLFGGVARTSMEAERPGDEFLIAAAGPIASIVIALAFIGLGRYGALMGLPPTAAGIASYMGILNLVLAAFNLLPGFPLDGGRLLRAAVWRLSGDLTRATRWAASAGRWLAYLIMALGIAQVVLGANFMGGLWLVFIGWFLKRAAQDSYQQHRVRVRLDGVRAAEAARPAPVVPASMTIADLVGRFLLRHPAYTFVVEEGGRTVGTLDLDEVRKLPESEWQDHTVGDTMKPAGDPASPDETLTRVMERLRRTRAPVLVFADDTLLGVIGPREAAPWLSLDEEP